MKIINHKVLKSPPQAVFIDLDDTLYDYQTAHQVALDTVLQMLSIQYGFNKLELSSAFSKARKQVKLLLKSNPSSRNRLIYFQSMFEILGLGSAPAWTLNCEQTYWQTFLKNLVPFDEVYAFLDNVRLLGAPRLIVSNQNTQIQLRKLCQLNLDESFEYVVTSESVGVEKPNALIFTNAIKKTDCDPASIWMIGDDLEADICGAKDALGCFTFLKRNNRKFTKQQLDKCDIVFENFSQLNAIISKIDGKKIS